MIIEKNVSLANVSFCNKTAHFFTFCIAIFCLLTRFADDTTQSSSWTECDVSIFLCC